MNEIINSSYDNTQNPINNRYWEHNPNKFNYEGGEAEVEIASPKK